MYKNKTNLKRCQERSMSIDVFLFSEIISCLLLKNKEVQSLPQVTVKSQKCSVVSSIAILDQNSASSRIVS